LTTAVLTSAGLDSVVLAASEARTARLQPIYVSAGLAWEATELAALERLLALPPLAGRVAPLAQLTFSVTDLYPATHWALRGEPPAFDTPDEDVYLAGRNVALLSKAAIYCARRRIDRIVIGPLAGNPFPDATPEFFRRLADALSLGLACPLTIEAPFVTRRKSDVIRLGVALAVPLPLTLSCMNPGPGQGFGGHAGIMHCGRCSKCRERRDAFAEAGVPDATAYAVPPPR
jgi:7-cyano-7-deazaguanine synthase